MHCVAAIIIGFYAWIALISYTVITDGRIAMAFIIGPFVVSGVSTIVMVADYTFWLISAVITKKFKTNPADRSVAEEVYELESAAGKGNKAG